MELKKNEHNHRSIQQIPQKMGRNRYKEVKKMETKEFLEQYECCNKKMRVILDVQVMDMQVNNESIALCKECGRIVRLTDMQTDEEELEVFLEDYPEAQ